MAKKRDYKYWESVVRASTKYRDKIISAEDFRVYTNYYKGRFNKEKKAVDRVNVNMVFSTTNILMSALASRDPWVAFKARKEEFKSSEELCEESLNNTMQDIDFKGTLQEVIRDAQLNGFGVGKAGYTYDADVVENKDKKKQAEAPEYNIHIKKDTVHFNLIDPKRILLDPTSLQGIKDSKFVIEVITQSKQYLSDTYGVDLKDISAGIPTFLKDQFAEFDKESQKIFDMGIFYEIWDIVNKKRIIMIEGYTDKLFPFDWPEGLTDKVTGAVEYPYELLIFNHAPNEPYGISDVSLYRTQQEELNTLRSMMSEAAKKNNPKWQAVADGTELKEIKKFLANDTGTVTGVKEANAISVIPPHQFPQDWSIHQANIKSDIQEIMGVNDAMKGAGGGKKTATQAYSEDFFAKLRIGARQNEVDNFVLRSAKKLFKIMQVEYDSPKFISLVGKEGQFISSQYTKKELDGEFDASLQQGTGAQNKSYLAQMVQQGLELTNGNPLLNPKVWTEIIIDVFFDGIDTSKLMIPNAEQIANDPIEREKWRQIMILVQQKNMIQQATQPQAQPGQQAMPGGNPVPGNAPQQPGLPSGAPPVAGM
jgi:hypothetical protein